MNTIWEKIRKRVVVFILIGTMVAFCSCSPSIENNATDLTETFATETTTETMVDTTNTISATLPKTQSTTASQVATTNMSMTQTATKQTPSLSDSAQLKSVYRSEDDSLNTDLRDLKLKAMPDDDQAIIQAVRYAYPSFDPADYKSTKGVRGEDNFFSVEYRLMIGEYATPKGYYIKFEDNQAIEISEWGASLSVSVTANDLPAITEQIIQAAYKQGREEVYNRNPNFVVQEQSGNAYYRIETGECIYSVQTVYTTSATSPAKGVVNTQYKIS